MYWRRGHLQYRDMNATRPATYMEYRGALVILGLMKAFGIGESK
jgi:hypothetical protein